MTPELHASKDALLDEMRDYQRFGGAEDENDPDFDPDFDAGYRPADIQRCGEVIDTLFEDLLQVPATERREAAFLAACPPEFRHGLAIRLGALGPYCGAIGAAAQWREDTADESGDRG